MKHLLILIFIQLLFIPVSKGQHTEPSHETEHEGHTGNTHKLTLVMAYSLLKNQVDENTGGILVVPTFGINYDFLFHPKWGVGVHSDIVLQQYKVGSHSDETTIIRENPVAICAVGLFSPIPSLIIGAGYGVEIESHENIQLFRVGVEYEFHLPNHWELGVMLEFDRKINTYNSWVFGVGFSKLFTKN